MFWVKIFVGIHDELGVDVTLIWFSFVDSVIVTALKISKCLCLGDRLLNFCYCTNYWQWFLESLNKAGNCKFRKI